MTATQQAPSKMTVDAIRQELRDAYGIHTRGNKAALVALLTEARKQSVGPEVQTGDATRQDAADEQGGLDSPEKPSEDGRSAPVSAQNDADSPPTPPQDDEQANAGSSVDVDAQEAALVLARRDPMPAPSVLPSAREWEATMTMAESIASTEFVPTSYRGRPEAVVAAILTGRELGIGPMQALRDIHIIDGRPALAAHLQLAKLRKGGVVILSSEVDDEHARIVARRRDTGEQADITVTYEEMSRVKDKRGGLLVDKANWRNYRQDMLWARCVGRISRRLAPDLVAGLPYTAEEVADFDMQDEHDQYRPMERGTLREQRRDHEPAPPKTWPQINEWADAYGPTLGWTVWLKQAAEAMFGKLDEGKKLSADQRGKLGVKAASVIYNLRQHFDPSGVPPPSRQDVQKAFARVLDGVELAGPEWRMGPGEDDRPTYAAVTGDAGPTPPTPPAEEPPEVVADADVTVEPPPDDGSAYVDPDDISWPDDPPFAGGQ